MVDHLKIFLTSSFINMQNSIIVSNTVCTHACPKNYGGCWGTTPWDSDVADPLEICLSPICVTMPNLVILVRVSLWRSARKFRPLVPIFQGHWKQHRSISYL